MVPSLLLHRRVITRLIYAPERGLVAFTVPHMAACLRSLPAHDFDNS
jgi:hypothetical protein